MPWHRRDNLNFFETSTLIRKTVLMSIYSILSSFVLQEDNGWARAMPYLALCAGLLGRLSLENDNAEELIRNYFEVIRSEDWA